jgi:hypothetical protein
MGDSVKIGHLTFLTPSEKKKILGSLHLHDSKLNQDKSASGNLGLKVNDKAIDDIALLDEIEFDQTA